MRTTVTLDPDTEALVRGEMSRSHVSFKRALNDAIRRGLGAHPQGGAAADVVPFRSDYQPGVDRMRLQQVADDIETDDSAARMSRRR